MNIKQGQSDRKKFFAKQEVMPFVPKPVIGRPRTGKGRRVIWVDDGCWARLVALAARENSTPGLIVEMMESICMPEGITTPVATNK